MKCSVVVFCKILGILDIMKWVEWGGVFIREVISLPALPCMKVDKYNFAPMIDGLMLKIQYDKSG